MDRRMRYTPSAMRPSSDPRSQMSQASPPADRPFTLFIIAAAFLGAALVLARTWNYGPGLGPDSVFYVETARNLLQGQFFTQIYGEPYVLHAPIYPALLAAASLSAFDPKDAVGPLNSAITAATALVAGRWIAERIKSRFLAAGSILAVACGHPLVWAGSIGFPVALFILLSTLALINAEAFFRNGGRKEIIYSTLFSALAWLTHYTGIAVVVWVGALLLLHQADALPAKAKRAASYLLITAAPMAMWWASVVYRAGEFAPHTRTLNYSLPAVAGDIATAVSKWAFVNLYVDSLRGDLAQWPIATALSAAALLALALGVGYGVVRAALRNGAGVALWERWGAVFVFGGFALTFLFLYFVALLMRQTWDGAQDRHLIPAYLPLFIAVVVALDRLIGRSRGAGRPLSIGGLSVRVSPATAITALGLWLALTLPLHIVAIREANAYGIAKQDIGVYGRPRWANSQTIAHIRENPPNGAVYSNKGEPLALYAPGLTIPRLRSFDAPADWAAAAPDGAALTWFHSIGGEWDYDAADLRMVPGLETVADLDDGALFRVNKAHNPRPAHQAAYDALADRETVVRSAYDVYLDGRTLIYAKSPCSREETAARFFLHVIPVDEDDLQDSRKRYGFDNLDFSFEFSGVRVSGACMVSVALPAYPIAEVATGQFAGGERLWETTFPPS